MGTHPQARRAGSMINSAAQKVVDAYKGFLADLKIAFGVALDMKSTDGVTLIRRFVSDTEALKRSRLRIVSEEVASSARAVAYYGIAQTASERLDRVEVEDVMSHADGLAESLVSALSVCMQRDIEHCASVIRRMSMQVMLSRGAVSLIRARMGQFASLSFEQRDAIGRRWKSEDYVRSMTRMTFILTYADSAVIAAHLQGIKRLVIVNPESTFDGTVFSVSDELDMPDYMSLRDTVFHPNSTATIAVWEGA